MRNVKVISMSLERDLVLELEKFSFVYFGGNKSRAIAEALKAFLPKYIEEDKRRKQEVKEIMDSIVPDLTPEEEERERLEIKEKERKWQEELKKRLEIENQRREQKRQNEEILRLKVDPNYQLWSKHHREVRTDPDHDSKSCYICNLLPEMY